MENNVLSIIQGNLFMDMIKELNYLEEKECLFLKIKK